jgi:tyrosyl-tRNA synthetase
MTKDQATHLVDDILSRGVGNFVDPDGKFRKKLIAKATGEFSGDVVIKLGADPTRPDIHLGHAVLLRKLRQMQDLGCKVVFIVGDFTAFIGDPTGKSKTRPELTQEAIEHNMKTYTEQIGKILRTEPEVFTWIRNSDWFLNVTDMQVAPDTEIKLNLNVSPEAHAEVKFDPNSLVGKAVVFEETRMQRRVTQGMTNITIRTLLWTLRHITFAQLVERDMFQKRIADNESLYMHEMLYPVIQGIDSEAIAQVFGTCDLEIGGTDQLFNILMGRRVMEMNGREPQATLAFELLVGTDGKEKMSKSLDNYIGITDTPTDMFGKIMSVPDSALPMYWKLCTFTPLDVVDGMMDELAKGKLHPKEVKMNLAQQVVEIYHGRELSKQARDDFDATFAKGGIPDDIETVEVEAGTLLSDIAVSRGFAPSKTEYRRLLQAGAIKKDGETKLDDPYFKIESDIVLKIGKFKFVKFTV